MGWGEFSGAGWFFKIAAKSLWLPRLFPRRWRGLLRYRLLPPEVDILGLPDKGDAAGATSTLGMPSDRSRSGLGAQSRLSFKHMKIHIQVWGTLSQALKHTVGITGIYPTEEMDVHKNVCLKTLC